MRGTRALASELLANAQSHTLIAALCNKHPAAPQAQPLQDDAVALQCDSVVMEVALARLEAKRGVAGGPTEWTHKHILAATKSSTEAFNSALAFINLILRESW